MNTEAKKIMVVDDSRSIREILAGALMEGGYESTKFEDGQQAFEHAMEGGSYDLVITDINMPNKDGISLISDLRRMSNFKFTPILVLTTESQTQKKVEAKEAGATGWIVKPFEKEKLLMTVKKVIR